VTNPPTFERLRIERRHRTAVVTLANGKVNALNREVLSELLSVVDFCEGDSDVDALVLTGEGSVFSAGLDVTEVLANDSNYTAGLLDDLAAVLIRIFSCPLPTVVAVNGSAIAGGCLLACAFDTRLLAEEARIGVTELKVGVAFPVMTVELLKHVCGPRAEQVMLNATLLEGDEAVLSGLVHQVVARSELDGAAITAAEHLGSLDARAYGLAKRSSRRSALAAMEDPAGRALNGHVLDHWNDEATRANLETLLAPRR
jgi:enoyl-CoA hydratase